MATDTPSDANSSPERVNKILSNGNFETSNLSPWVTTTPNGSCLNGGTTSRLCTLSAQTYVISFWMAASTLGSGISATVTIQ